MILVGDIGASKTLLAVGEFKGDHWQTSFEQRYADDQYQSFSALLKDFLARSVKVVGRRRIERTCFGVAGPVGAGHVRLTNRDWELDPHDLVQKCGIPLPRLINDLVATAHGIASLGTSDLITVQPGTRVASGCRAVLGIGTGFGAAYVVEAAGDYRVIASEAGHAAFAPRVPEEMALWDDLYRRKRRVQIEDVVSGIGLVNIYHHLCRRSNAVAASPTLDSGVAIARAADEGDETARHAVDMFVDCCAATAGDQALAFLPCGGLYLTGGIPRQLISGQHAARFVEIFNDKGAHASLTRQVPVYIVVNDAVNLFGCAQVAVSTG